MTSGVGSHHPNVARDLNNLAELLPAANRLSEAEPLIRRALAIKESSYGADHPEVAINLNDLVELLRAMNRPEEAERYLSRRSAIAKRATGQGDANTQRKLGKVSSFFEEAGL